MTEKEEILFFHKKWIKFQSVFPLPTALLPTALLPTASLPTASLPTAIIYKQLTPSDSDAFDDKHL